LATLTFLGATGTVTGSKYLLEAGGERLMVDCGLFQGEKELRLRNWNPLPVPPSSIHWLLLTHAHLDHVGYIPRLVKDGFRGQILASAATVDLAKIVLPDSGHLQEEDAEFANKKGFSKHAPALPLYTYEEAIKSLEYIHAVNAQEPVEISSHFTLRSFFAGHILGARMLEVTVRENGTAKRILFSGDLGRFHQLVIPGPAVPGDGYDYMLLESTYGDRLHPKEDIGDSLFRRRPHAGIAFPLPRVNRGQQAALGADPRGQPHGDRRHPHLRKAQGRPQLGIGRHGSAGNQAFFPSQPAL
jgi:metallo-beta-lactamase family protein